MDGQKGSDPVTGTGTGVIYIELFRALKMGKAKSCCNCSFPSKDEMPFLSVSFLRLYKQALFFSSRNPLLRWKKMSGFWDADLPLEWLVETRCRGIVRPSVRTPLPPVSNHSGNSSRSCRICRCSMVWDGVSELVRVLCWRRLRYLSSFLCS